MTCEHKWGPTIYSYKFDKNRNMIRYCFDSASATDQYARFCVECGQVEHKRNGMWFVSTNEMFSQDKIEQMLSESEERV